MKVAFWVSINNWRSTIHYPLVNEIRSTLELIMNDYACHCGGLNYFENQKFLVDHQHSAIDNFLTHLTYDDYFEDNEQVHCVAILPASLINRMNLEMKRIRKLRHVIKIERVPVSQNGWPMTLFMVTCGNPPAEAG